jgi:hypothetical protein
VMDAESQVLNTLTIHDFQDACKKWQAFGRVLMLERELLRGWWWPVGPKLFFNQMAAPVLEIMDGSLYLHFHFIIIYFFLTYPNWVQTILTFQITFYGLDQQMILCYVNFVFLFCSSEWTSEWILKGICTVKAFMQIN